MDIPQSPLDLVSLRFFAETARSGSISKAAAALGVVQPALTRRIQLLEDRLGTPLFARHRRGVEPTEAGRLLLERADIILRLTQQLEHEIRYLGAEPAGPVALGFPASIGILLVGKLLSRCSERHPRIKLSLQENYSLAVRASLLAGSLDLGIMSWEAQHPELHCQPLFRESMWLISRAKDWRFPNKVIDPKVLDGLPLLVGSFMHTLLERHLARTGIKLTVVAEADSFSLAREALRAGAGFFVGPYSALGRELGTREFTGAPLNGLELTRGLFRHRDRPLARAGITVSDMIEQEAAQLIAAQPQVFRRISGADAGALGTKARRRSRR